MLTDLRWRLAKFISPYEVMAVGLTIKDGVMTFPAGTKNAVVERCTFKES